MIIDSGVVTGSLTVSGSFNQQGNAYISGSLVVSGVINAIVSGSIDSASFASTARSSSYANVATSSSFASTATSSSFASTSTSGSYAATSSFASNFTVANTLTATTLVVNTISSSITYSSGSNVFGNSISNTQVMTGSLQVTGSTHYLLGNVGIGTLTPSALLHVYGPNFPLARIERYTSLSTGMRSTFSAIHTTTSDMVDGFGADISFGIKDSAGVDNEIANFGAIRDGADNSGALVFATTNAGAEQGTPKMILKANGNVGIGTTSPNGKLTLSYSSSLVDGLILINTASGGRQWRIGDGAGASAGSFGFYDATAAATRMTLDTSGNLGLGVTPSAWSSFRKSIEIGASGNSIAGSTSSGVLELYANSYINTGGNYVYSTSSTAGLYQINGNSHQWYTAPSGTAGTGISFTQAMTLASSGNLLVGTTTDSGYKLDVNGTGRFVSTWGASASNPFLVVERSGGAVSSAIGYDNTNTGMYFGTTTNHRLALRTNNTDVLLLASTGAATFSSSVTAGNTLTVNAGANDAIFSNVTGAVIGFKITQSNAANDALFRMQTNGHFYDIRANAANALSFEYDGASRIYLNSSGNLGLGVTPSAWSSSRKAFEFGNVGKSLSGGGNVTEISLSGNAYDATGGWTYANTAQATLYQQYNGLHAWYTAPSGTGGTAISFTQAMTLNANGKLSIGNTNNTYNLDVTGNGNTARLQGGTSTFPNLRIQSAIYPTIEFISDDTNTGNRNWKIASVYNQYGMFEIVSSTTAGGTDYTSRLAIANSGNVLIGTTTDSGYKLDVNGTGRFSGNLVSSAQLQANSTSGATNGIILSAVSGYASSLNFSRSGYNNWYIGSPSNSTSLVIGGNIDMATSAFLTLTSTGAATFSSSITATSGTFVTSGTKSTVAIGNTASSTYSQVLMYGGATKYNWSIGAQYNVNNALEITPSTATEGTTFSTPVVTILQSGNVGIGTTSPSADYDKSLTVYGTNPSYIVQTNDNTGYAYYHIKTPSYDWSMGYDGANNFKISNGTHPALSTKLTLTSSGNLGLGVTPSAWSSNNSTLQLKNGAISSATFGTTTFTWLGSNWYNDGTSDKFIVNGKAALISLVNGGLTFNYTSYDGVAGNTISFTQALRIVNNGNVLIGTNTDSGYKLDVNGTGRFISTISANNQITVGDGTTAANSSINFLGVFGVSYQWNLYNDANGFTIYSQAGVNALRLVATTGAATFSSSVSAVSVAAASSGTEQAILQGGYLQFYNAAASNKWIKLTDDASTINAIGFSKSGSVATTWFPSGNVLIGTTTDSGYKLQVNSGAIRATQNSTYDSENGPLIAANGTTPAKAVHIGYDSAQDGGFISSIYSGQGWRKLMLNVGAGNVLIGTTSQDGKLAVNGVATSAPLVTFYSSTAGDVGQAGLLIGKQDNNTTTSQIILRASILSTGAGAGQINMNGANSLAFGTYSDIRLKENIINLPSQLDNIMKLRPVEFDYIESEGGGHQIGFIAQEMEKIYPDAVGKREDDMLTVSGWSKTEARLVKAIQELKAELDLLKNK